MFSDLFRIGEEGQYREGGSWSIESSLINLLEEPMNSSISRRLSITLLKPETFVEIV